MVVIPKLSGTVRICVDLTKLNQSAKRECHILPFVEQVLAQIGNAKVFSKLEANFLDFGKLNLQKSLNSLLHILLPTAIFVLTAYPSASPLHLKIFSRG